MVRDDFDARLRQAAMLFLQSVQRRTGGPVRRADIQDFTFDGQRIPLMDIQRGIRKPRMLDAALSFRTVHASRPDDRPYDDSPGRDGFLRYKWRGTDPEHAENRALRRAFEGNLPLIWFQGVDSGIYLPIFPVYLLEEERSENQFIVALGEEQVTQWIAGTGLTDEARRQYAERVVKQRLHQPLFRARVLMAYDRRCALCRFRHIELLDAAHIQSDGHGGQPIVPNGIAMCKIHHAAFDENFLGVDPDYRVHIRPDLLDEVDGPTLRTLQELHGSALEVPRVRAARPDRELLSERYSDFLLAS